jgi:hypothetical protein
MKVNLKGASSWLVRDLTIGFALSVLIAASVPVYGQTRAFVAEDLGVVRNAVGELNNHVGETLAVVLSRNDEVVVRGFKPNCRPETSLPVSVLQNSGVRPCNSRRRA